MTSRPRTLDGILVVPVEQAVAAPFAIRQRADLDARVIKVERSRVVISPAAITRQSTASPANSCV